MSTKNERKLGLPFDAAGEAISAVSEGLLNKPIDPKTLENWLTLSKAIRAIDYQIDTTQDNTKRQTFEEELTSYLERSALPKFSDVNFLVTNRVTALKVVLDRLDESDRDKFCERGEKILGIIEQTRTESNIKKYAELRREEGKQAILLYVDLLPSPYKTLEGYEKFVSWLSHWLPVGTSLYTAWNLDHRYQNGEVLVEPTAKNRLTILNEALPDLIAGARVTNRKVLTGQIPFFFRFAGSMLHHKT